LLLFIGLALLAIAVSKKPTLVFFFLTTKGRAHIFLVGFVALFGAFGLRQLGGIFLMHKSLPWYSRRGSFLLLVIMATIYCLVAALIDSEIFAAIKVDSILTEKAYVYEFFGFVLIWTMLLQCVSYK
jgi:hypothetical protein